MNKQTITILVDDHPVMVKTLGPRLAMVVYAVATLKVSANDIVRLSHDPGEADGDPQLVEILHRANPVLSEIEFSTEDGRNRMIALAAVLGAVVVDIRDAGDDYPGTIRIGHPAHIDIPAIAEAAGVTREWDLDEDFDEDDDEGDDSNPKPSDTTSKDPETPQ
jgi:hypothetical protein